MSALCVCVAAKGNLGRRQHNNECRDRFNPDVILQINDGKRFVEKARERRDAASSRSRRLNEELGSSEENESDGDSSIGSDENASTNEEIAAISHRVGCSKCGFFEILKKFDREFASARVKLSKILNKDK